MSTLLMAMISLIELIAKWLQENKDLNYMVSRFTHTDLKGVIIHMPLNLNKPLFAAYIDESKVNIIYPYEINVEASDPEFFKKLRKFLLERQEERRDATF